MCLRSTTPIRLRSTPTGSSRCSSMQEAKAACASRISRSSRSVRRALTLALLAGRGRGGPPPAPPPPPSRERRDVANVLRVWHGRRGCGLRLLRSPVLEHVRLLAVNLQPREGFVEHVSVQHGAL